MYTIVMLCNPSDGSLDPVLAETLRSAWGGTTLRWLAFGEAVEFDVSDVPDNFWDVWESLQEQKVDIAVVPKKARQKKMLFADMDSTMIEQECIDELAEAAGVGERVKEITARAMNGELDFEQALRARVSLLADLPAGIVNQVLNDRITLMPGGMSLLATMKKNGARAVLVSGGFTAFSGPIAAQLGFDENRANTLITQDGVLTGEVSEPILGREAKVSALEEFCEKYSVREHEVVAVGDGANDLGMLDRAGMGVALHAKPIVAQACQFRINHGDLTALLYLQGYTKKEFAA